MRDPRLPPRPPKLRPTPPGLLDKWFWFCLATNGAALGLNGWLAWGNRAGGWLLFVNCGGLAVTVISFMRFVDTCYREVAAWRMMRRHYEAVLDDIDAVTVEVMDRPEGIDRDEFFRRIREASERTVAHMRGYR